MKNIVLIIFGIIGLTTLIFVVFFVFDMDKFMPEKNVFLSSIVASHRMEIGGQILNLEIAMSVVDRERGLSYRQSVASTTGMLFVFDTPATYGFWMKNMNFPIDIIWFDENMKIVYTKKKADPGSYPTVFTPSVPAKYVLETNQGFVAGHNIKIGDQARILK